ncbi:probable inactive 1-aminocyclopropane-1-carboxylate synthase-like protein 2 isoform X2 [Oryctolagus cuniculus]|uniref:probable inactive 1-aminocyclopropane-1-carboxylate synthase-like protein 2 isoform X2 n=1 Tax=Oryctolagus cuniculus TaxID=9986 RepID=UPI00222EF449|nr:probable inactive 1-aminocyclopropane-1-carboxylate synthase-like protein 2 [Oryctolagus cuniculus]XP_051682123.1 probable inactive 1-aminocyclopropane-1-carboxylate synthase-like protein 2 [Oryctolagus cuniculus]XP_051682133.1 probable inactive 1-aminocyclopropane-1-carboxylate synthase-like protein 2 [Oryctolagus cuniculus]XP_051682143.1 probable inactive 1-aminocyclopropane-1-carboxylate synthase-like protein 2 [Oryctolagus cuniculus]
MSHRPDTPTVPRGQTRSQFLREQRVCTDLLEMIRHLQQSLKEHFTQLTTWQMQGLLSLEQRHSGAICKQEDLLDDLMCKMVNLLGSEAVSGLGLRPPLPVLDSQAANRGVRRVSSPQQADQPVPQQRDSEATLVSHDLSSRGIEISVSYHLDFQDYEAYQRDKYHKVKNTLGFINLGTSENKLCTYLLTERLCRSDMNRMENILLQYPDWRGQPFLRKEVACFLTDYCQAPSPLDPENVVILNGCYSIFSALAMVLCDPGEAFLVPTPFFGGFIFSSNLYARVELIPVHLESEVSENTHPFQLTVNKLEQALVEARLKRKKVKGLMLVNPRNCLGDVCSRDSLQEYLEFAKRNRLHVIVDESYMLSVFDGSATFHSVLSLTSLPDPNRTHVIWGTSKDFGISGLRLGALYTHSKGVASAVCSFGCLHGTSGVTQYKLYRLLQDREWIDKVYLPTNRSRLQDAYKYITDELKALEVPFLKGGSGLSVWVSLKSYLEPCTFDGELALHRRFLDNKLVLSRGKSFRCEEPGWFRLTFAEKPSELQVAMHRFRQVLEEQKQEWIVKQLADAMRE